MKYRAILITFLITCSLSPNSKAVTVGQFINPLEDFLECDSNNSAVQIICNDVQEIVNRELAQANLELQDGGLLFTKTDNTRVNVKGGCSSRTDLNKLVAGVKLLSDASVDLSGNAISKPVIFAIELPVEANVEAFLKTRYGARVFFGSCSQYASDSFRIVGDANGNAKLALFLSLEPKLTISNDGEIIVRIKPIVDVSAAVDAEVTRLKIKDTSPILGFIGTISGIISAPFKLGDAVLRGKSVTNALEGIILNIGLGLTLTETGLGGSLISDYAENYANDQVDDQIDELGLEQVEMDLERNIKRALRLDENGERYFVFDLNFSPKVANSLHRYVLKTDKPDYFKTRDCTTRWVFPGSGGNRRNEREFEPIEIEECGAYYWKPIVATAPTTIVPITPPVQYDPPTNPTPNPGPRPDRECETYGNTTYQCR